MHPECDVYVYHIEAIHVVSDSLIPQEYRLYCRLIAAYSYMHGFFIVLDVFVL